MRIAALALAALLFSAAPAPGTPIGALDEADQAAVEALALYDRTTTRHALQAVTEADVLTDLVRQQERSRERFRQLLAPYPRDLQEQLFEITRYPELIAQIVEGGAKSGDELEAIAAGYPEETRAAALAAGSSHWKVLARIDALLRDEAAWLEARIGDLPEEKRDAFRALVATPELLALLAENTTLAVLLGDAYERDPEAVVAWLAEVRHEAEEQGAREAREFVQGVEEDSELAGEIEAATVAYQEETGYSAYRPTVVHRTHVYVRPYAYWVGYPWWYDVSYSYHAPWYYWYPRTHWAFGSFYFGPRLLVSFGVPHGGFWGWYFHRPIHHYHYPRVTHHVVRHYDRHHHPHRYWHRRHHLRHRRTAAYAVHHFRRDVERSMPRALLRDHDDRVHRLREYGRLRSDWDREHRRERRNGREVHRRSEMVTRVKADAHRYPHLQKLLREPREHAERKTRATRDRLDPRHRPTRARQETRHVRVAPEPRHVKPERQRRVQSQHVRPQREAKRRPAPQHRVEKPQRRQESRHAKPERARPERRQAKREHHQVAKRSHAGRGGSRHSRR